MLVHIHMFAHRSWACEWILSVWKVRRSCITVFLQHSRSFVAFAVSVRADWFSILFHHTCMAYCRYAIFCVYWGRRVTSVISSAQNSALLSSNCESYSVIIHVHFHSHVFDNLTLFAFHIYIRSDYHLRPFEHSQYHTFRMLQNYVGAFCSCSTSSVMQQVPARECSCPYVA